jgi:hypothetical protein
MEAPKPSQIEVTQLTSSQMTLVFPGEATERVWNKIE